MTGIRLRDFRSGDLEDAYRLDQACFEPEIAYTRGQIREFLSRPNATGVVAEIGDGLAGFAIGNRSGTRGHIVTIDVPADQRITIPLPGRYASKPRSLSFDPDDRLLARITRL